MSKWLLRGMVFAALMVVVRLVQGALINRGRPRRLLISVSLVAVFAIWRSSGDWSTAARTRAPTRTPTGATTSR